MHFLILKKDRAMTLSRKQKKISLSNFFISKTNYILFCTSFRYSLLNYFLKNNKLNLNRLILCKIIIEELGTSFSLANWLYSFYNKSY
nr:ribosomal protein L20 [Lithothamnion corallioides]